MNRITFRAFSIVFVALLLVRTSDAHFPWLALDQDGNAVFFFGESPAERSYKLPKSISKATVKMLANGKHEEVKMTTIETDDFVGKKSTESLSKKSSLFSSVTYGVYQGARLDYTAAHVGGALPKSRQTSDKSKLPKLSAELIDTESGVDVYVTWKGKPLAGVEVHLFCEEGHEEGLEKTDEAGKVTFSDSQVEDGLNGIMLGHTVKGESGKVGEKEYDSSANYLTITFIDPQDFDGK